MAENKEDLSTTEQYSALSELNRKLTAIVNLIAEQGGAGSSDGRGVINLQDWEDLYGIDFMTNGALRSTVLEMLNERPEIRDWELEGGQLIVYRELEETAVEVTADVKLDEVSTGNDLVSPATDNISIELSAAPQIQPDLSDPDVTRTDMYAYGYTWDGMIPLGKERALELFDEGYGIYRLYDNDAEGLIESREEIFEFDGLFGTEDPAWIKAEQERGQELSVQPMQVFVYNHERSQAAEKAYNADGRKPDEGLDTTGEKTGADVNKPSGEWLTLPADAVTLQGVLERIGIENDGNVELVVTAIRVPEYLADYVSKNDSIDELNMLASYLNDMEDFEIEKLQAILSGGLAAGVNDTRGLINLLSSKNFDAFVMIDAKDYEALGQYYGEYKPEGVSFEEFGKQNADDDGGKFIDGNYIYHRYNEILPKYDGVVPDDYKIVDSAIKGLQPKKTEPKQDEQAQSSQSQPKKPSVLEQLWSSRKKSKEAKSNAKDTAKDTANSKDVGKDSPKPKKHKGGPEL